jgi:hypothetical protein
MKRRTFPPEIERLHREQRSCMADIIAWAEKSDIDVRDRERLCTQARNIIFNTETSIPGDGYRFKDEANALCEEVERFNPEAMAEIKRSWAKRKRNS